MYLKKWLKCMSIVFFCDNRNKSSYWTFNLHQIGFIFSLKVSQKYLRYFLSILYLTLDTTFWKVSMMYLDTNSLKSILSYLDTVFKVSLPSLLFIHIFYDNLVALAAAAKRRAHFYLFDMDIPNYIRSGLFHVVQFSSHPRKWSRIPLWCP